MWSKLSKLYGEYFCIKLGLDDQLVTTTAERYNDIPFETNELTAIYFGCHVSDEQKRTLALLAKENFQHISLYQTHFAPQKYDLIIEPYNLD